MKFVERSLGVHAEVVKLYAYGLELECLNIFYRDTKATQLAWFKLIGWNA